MLMLITAASLHQVTSLIEQETKTQNALIESLVNANPRVYSVTYEAFLRFFEVLILQVRP